MTVEAELADGRILEFPDGTHPDVVQATVKKMLSPQQKQVGPQDALFVPDVLAHLASGAVSAPLSGLAGIVGSLLPGPEGQGAKLTKTVGDALTYQPRTATGEAAAGLIAKPFEWLHALGVKAGEKAQDMGAPAGLATGIQTAIEGAPALLPMGLKRSQSPKVAAAQSLNEVKDATYNAARQEGYVFPPSASGGGGANAVMEGMAGKQLLNQEATIRNQKVTNSIAAREVGLPENTAITPGRLDLRRRELAEPYREVAAIDPLVAEDLVELRTKRAEAQKLYRFYEAHPNPMIERKAQRLMDRAEVLEGYIEDAAKNIGKPDLVERLRKARQEIAKTYDVERALIEGMGDVSAAEFGKMLDKGKPLSGGLETIAKAHQAFRPYMGDAANISNPGVARTRGALGVAANATGLHGGLGWLTEGIPMLAGPARSGILSNAYQNAIGRPSYPNSQLLPGVLEGILAQQAQEGRK